jgi:acetoin utilization protein AcuB
MKVSEIMTKPVVTIGLDDNVKEIENFFAQSMIRHILVVEEGELIGLVSERDLLRSMSPNIESLIYTTRDLAALSKPVHQIVTRTPISLNLNAGINEVINIFKTTRIGCIPIVDDNNIPVGIITRSDVFHHFDEICAVYFQKED